MHRGHLTGWVPSAVAHLKLSPFQQQRLRCLPTTRHIQFDYSTQITPTLLVLQLNSRHTSHSMSSRQVAKASALPHCPAPVSVVSFFTPDNHNTAQHRAHTRHIVRWRVAQLGGGQLASGGTRSVSVKMSSCRMGHTVWRGRWHIIVEQPAAHLRTPHLQQPSQNNFKAAAPFQLHSQ